MFKRDVKSLADILQTVLRKEGFETPLLQKRLIESWDAVVGPTVARYTGDKFIKILNPALRQDLSMMRQKLVQRLNSKVGSFIISDIKFY